MVGWSHPRIDSSKVMFFRERICWRVWVEGHSSVEGDDTIIGDNPQHKKAMCITGSILQVR